MSRRFDKMVTELALLGAYIPNGSTARMTEAQLQRWSFDTISIFGNPKVLTEFCLNKGLYMGSDRGSDYITVNTHGLRALYCLGENLER